MEEAVRREIHEEAGVTCGAVRYMTSQPWPFGGSQLMIACVAEAQGNEITLDTNELEAAMWVTKEEARVALADAPGKTFSAPPPFAIANTLLRRWAASNRAIPAPACGCRASVSCASRRPVLQRRVRRRVLGMAHNVGKEGRRGEACRADSFPAWSC